MGECGCGDIVPEAVYKTGGLYIVVNRYPGCSYCAEPPSVDLLFFDERGYQDFGQDVPPLVVWPDSYGGNDGTDRHGWGNIKGRAQFAFPSPEDLALAAEVLAADDDAEPFEAYGDLAEYLRDQGLRLMQTAMRIASERRREHA